MFVFSLDGSRNQAGLRRHSSSAFNSWSSSWIVAANLSGSCSTMALSQSSLQRVLVLPGKVSPPKWSRHVGSQLSNHAASWRLLYPLTSARLQPPACNGDERIAREQLSRQISFRRKAVCDRDLAKHPSDLTWKITG